MNTRQTTQFLRSRHVFKRLAIVVGDESTFTAVTYTLGKESAEVQLSPRGLAVLVVDKDVDLVRLPYPFSISLTKYLLEFSPLGILLVDVPKCRVPDPGKLPTKTCVVQRAFDEAACLHDYPDMIQTTRSGWPLWANDQALDSRWTVCTMLPGVDRDADAVEIVGESILMTDESPCFDFFRICSQPSTPNAPPLSVLGALIGAVPLEAKSRERLSRARDIGNVLASTVLAFKDHLPPAKRIVDHASFQHTYFLNFVQLMAKEFRVPKLHVIRLPDVHMYTRPELEPIVIRLQLLRQSVYAMDGTREFHLYQRTIDKQTIYYDLPTCLAGFDGSPDRLDREMLFWDDLDFLIRNDPDACSKVAIVDADSLFEQASEFQQLNRRPFDTLDLGWESTGEFSSKGGKEG
jgi:hypothetical protein